MHARRCLLTAFAALLAFGLLSAQQTGGLKPTVFAVKDARVVTEPGKVLPKATVVVRDGVIESVGPDVPAPPDALVIDGKGLTVYPGFLDALSNWGFDPALRRSEGGPPATEDFASDALAATKPDNRKGMTPEFAVASALKVDEEQADAWRRVGFTAHLIAPDGGFFTGQSALVSLSGTAPREAVLRAPVALHASFRPVAGSDYPRVLMGALAHARQALFDAGHARRARQAFDAAIPGSRRPAHDPALDALADIQEGRLPVVFEADSRDEIHRALDFAKEFNLRPILFGGRDAWKVADRLKQENVSVLLRINFADQPQARRGRRGPPVATPEPAPGQEREPQPTIPPKALAERQRLLKEEMQNAAKLAKAGIPFALCTQGLPAERPADKFRENLRKVIAEGLPPDAALAALTTAPARILGVEKQLGTVAPGKAAHLVVTEGDFHDAKTRIRYVFADGVRFEHQPATEQAKADAKKSDAEKKDAPKVGADVATETEEDRKPKLRTGGNVLIRGANLLTVAGPNLPRTDLLVRHGKIAAVGANLQAPDGVTVLNAEGLFVMPGIIDTHCHFAIAGGINESSLSVVPEARVRDVIDGEDVQIFRGLAGGVTTARLLHGSANVVGGQDAVIKMKYGQPASQLLIADAPRGVKFALGENVKRTDGRFPNTRLGVEAVLVRAFSEAQAYRRAWDSYHQARGSGKPVAEPRRDLRLEALADVLRGDLKVHSHCYRADEILMLLRVADRFGFKVQSLQHVLEGYKIAAEIADHGASCSTFSDWWAYKLEAYDAIPHNAALLQEAGASVVLKSDSNELMRHLYQEAAKCLKYGGMTESEALKTITLNAAKQLGLEKRTGTLEVGKDADLAIFNGHPLNAYARVEMTLVEGEVYFQRSERLQPASLPLTGPTPTNGGLKPIPASPRGLYALRGATVHPVSGPDLTGATVVIDKGRIVAVGKDVTIPEGATVVDAAGLHVYPGMIDAATVLGLTELGSAKETQDYAEGGDFQPDLRAGVAVNPDSELIPVTRANGVTTVLTRPSGAVIAGQSALINLNGWVPREMIVVDPVALHIELPTASPFFGSDPGLPSTIGRAVARKQREEKVRRAKDLFRQALAYDAARKANPDRPVNPRLEALVPYARGTKPVVIQASRRQEIEDALKLADELKLKLILSGGLDAWKLAAELKKRDVPVILGPVMALPAESHDPFDAPFAAAAKLREAGVRFCIRSAGSTNTRNLPYEAAMAVAYGLPPEEGLKAVTLYPAQILGVADQLGSVESGRRANLVLADGDLLQTTTRVRALFIDGRPLEPTSKHTRLYERYRQRLQEVKEGRVPLGTK